MKRFFTIILICCIHSYWSFSQTLPSSLNFHTPEVSAFNRNIEVPVSLYTGLPNIIVPLYEIKIKDVSVPITLDYHAGGIRVDQEATWVGLGWNLSYGGEISRKVRGIADEKYFLSGGYQPANSVDSFKTLPFGNETDLQFRLDKLISAKFGNTDYMPDEFYYSAVGHSGRFMFSQKKNSFVIFPKEDIAIQSFPQGNQPSYSSLYYWNLKLPNGTSIDFGKDATVEQTQSYTEYTKNTWQIIAIKNIYNENINYNYESFDYNQLNLTGENYHVDERGSVSDNLSNSGTIAKTGYHDVRVKSITFPNGYIDFITTGRDDMPTKKLSEIDVRDNNNNLIRKINFYYSYFYASSFDIIPVILPGFDQYYPQNYRFNRLRLDSIVVSNANTAQQKYSFDYYTSSSMPSKTTFAQDHWGFFNGMPNMGRYTLIPDINHNMFSGGDRRVNPSVANLFSLKSITYPEGGHTTFSYESNTASAADVPNDLLETYQDDNLAEVESTIHVGSYSRNTFYPLPNDSINGTKIFKKQFTVANNSYSFVGVGWNVNTNYGISSLEASTPFNADNVVFKLEKINTGGSRTVIKSFNTTAIYGNNDGTYTRNGHDTSAINMSAGLYEMTVEITYANQPNSPADMQPYNLFFTVKWRELNMNTQMVYTGGLRIHSITHHDINTADSLRTEYGYINPNANPSVIDFTSGRLISFPKYFQYDFKWDQYAANGSGTTIMGLNFYSNSVLPLETTSGSYSGYEFISETKVDYNHPANNQMTTSHYSFQSPYFSQYYPYQNLGSWEPTEWTRGKLLYKWYYKGNNIIKKEEYNYYDWSPHLANGTEEDNVTEINTNFLSRNYLYHAYPQLDYAADFYDNAPKRLDYQRNLNLNYQYGCFADYYGCADYYFSTATSGAGLKKFFCDNYVALPYFIHYTGFDRMKALTTTLFSDDNKNIITTVNYFYDKTPTLYQISRTETIDSKGDTLKSLTNYPSDFPSISPYNTMLARHIIDPPVHQFSYKNSFLLQTTKTNYKNWSNNIIAPETIESSTRNNQSYIISKYYAYDTIGNLLSVSKNDYDIKHTYLWGYNRAYPIASIINSDQSRVLYTSFETDNDRSWILSSTTTDSGNAITGKKSYTLSSNASLSNRNPLPAGNYIVSYWLKTGSGTATANNFGSVLIASHKGWSFYQRMLTNITSVTITGTATIDEVRLYPADAQMTTYTYQPLVGLTSECDENNRITYFEYDGLGRLERVRDLDGYILKQYAYKYDGQPSSNTTPFCASDTISYTNAIAGAYTLTLTNTASGTESTYTFNSATANGSSTTAAGNAFPNVPSGIYDIKITPSIAPGQTVIFEVGSFTQQDKSFSASNISVECPNKLLINIHN